MATITVSTNASLDGVVQGPDGGEGTRLGGWFARTVGDGLVALTYDARRAA